MKIVVFDLDETLGYFTEFGIFWDCLEKYLKPKKITLTQNNFDAILDLFPEFLRPNIINILTYLKTKKLSKCCNKMLIYTNNNGPKEWAHYIIKYFETKLNFKLIDQVIAAFKINGRSVEIYRTTHDKTHKDLIRCTKIDPNADICFIDDTFYPEMVNDNIYYINIKPYYHDLPFDLMIKRLVDSSVGKKIINHHDFKTKIMEYINHYKYECLDKDSKEYEIDKILGKHIITHLQEFFNKSKKNITYKKRIKQNAIHNKTAKKR
jgi:hypothetical protein